MNISKRRPKNKIMRHFFFYPASSMCQDKGSTLVGISCPVSACSWLKKVGSDPQEVRPQLGIEYTAKVGQLRDQPRPQPMGLARGISVGRLAGDRCDQENTA